MKKTKLLSAILILFGIGCLAFGASRYLVETRIQQPVVNQEGVQNIGTGIVNVKTEEEPEAKPEETGDEPEETPVLDGESGSEEGTGGEELTDAQDEN